MRKRRLKPMLGGEGATKQTGIMNKWQKTQKNAKTQKRKELKLGSAKNSKVFVKKKEKKSC
jgi:hypothetical protein